MLSIECQAELSSFHMQLRFVRKIVSDSAAPHDKNNFKSLSDFGSYMSWNITFSVFIVTELCPTNAHFCGQMLLRDPGCLSSHTDLLSELLLPRHCQYIDS